MKLRAASRSSSLSNATSRSGADPNMCRNDHSAKRLPRSNSGSASVDFAPQSRSAILLLLTLRADQMNPVGGLLCSCLGFLCFIKHLLSPFGSMVASCDPALWRKMGVPVETVNRRPAHKRMRQTPRDRLFSVKRAEGRTLSFSPKQFHVRRGACTLLNRTILVETTNRCSHRFFKCSIAELCQKPSQTTN